MNGREIISKSGRMGVLLPLVFAKPFDYRVPEGMTLRQGDFVRVPFGRRSVWGVVWDEAEGNVEESKLKSVEAHAAHLHPLSEAMRSFLNWVSWYTLAPLGLVLKMVLPVPDALEPPKTEARYRLKKTEEAVKATPSRLRIISYLSDGVERTQKEIAVYAKVSVAVVREFIKAGGLEMSGAAQVTRTVPSATLHVTSALHSLSADQDAAADILKLTLDKGFFVTLLDGVTGSGKTEVYFDAIGHAVAKGKQVLVLLPEIALSVQWLARFEARFGFAPELWHSAVTPASRINTWRRIAEGTARVVVGARSALFLPFMNLGLIVVDEEHDASYKQEEGVIYHARDMAVARGRHEKIPIILVSATPSLETEFNVGQGRYRRVQLHHRHNAAQLPQVKLVDMRLQKLKANHWLSEPVKSALRDTVTKGRQAMLFMNRRGYAPLMLCRACGHRFACPHCSAFLVLHRSRSRLLCHHCGFETAPPNVCPDCGHADAMIPYGPGVERIAEEAAALLPDARIKVMTSDESDTPAKAHALITAMANRDIDILIGTQMIAKGHHFAGLAFVGVIDADMGLGGGDLRAGERTYQLLHQVAGRAGREQVKGEVLLQTYMPDHPVMLAMVAGDRDRFMALEASMRSDAGMPPYGKLAAIIVEGRVEREVAECARNLVKSQGSDPKLISDALLVLGPAPAPLSLLRGRYRWRILIKAARHVHLQDWLSAWLAHHKIPGGLRVKIDVEPYSFL